MIYSSLLLGDHSIVTHHQNIIKFYIYKYACVRINVDILLIYLTLYSNFGKASVYNYRYSQVRTDMHPCTGTHTYAFPCTSMHRYPQVRTPMRTHAQVCTGTHRYAHLCVRMHKHTQVPAGMHKCVSISFC